MSIAGENKEVDEILYTLRIWWENKSILSHIQRQILSWL